MARDGLDVNCNACILSGRLAICSRKQASMKWDQEGMSHWCQRSGCPASWRSTGTKANKPLYYSLHSHCFGEARLWQLQEWRSCIGRRTRYLWWYQKKAGALRGRRLASNGQPHVLYNYSSGTPLHQGKARGIYHMSIITNIYESNCLGRLRYASNFKHAQQGNLF